MSYSGIVLLVVIGIVEGIYRLSKKDGVVDSSSRKAHIIRTSVAFVLSLFLLLLNDWTCAIR